MRPLLSEPAAWWLEIKHLWTYGSASPFFSTEDINAVHEYFSARYADMHSIPDSTGSLSGHCFVCRKDVDFQVAPAPDGGTVNWRESLVCPQCHMINRWRACLHLFEYFCQPAPQDRIYLTETLSPSINS